MYFTAIAIALALVSPSVATGINCNGSGLCNLGGDVASSLVNAINGIDPNRWYNNGEQIACIVGGRGQAGVCAFLQNSGGAPGHSIKTLAPYIPGHGYVLFSPFVRHIFEIYR
jgi:hypothetical protein